MELKKVAVVILNYNGKNWLEKFLPNVIMNSCYDWCEVVVADNASVDDSVIFMQQAFPSIRLIVNKTNQGYAGGYNEALAQIDTPFYVLLNSDVELTENWLPPLLSFMESDAQIGAVQPMIKSFYEKNKFEYAGAAGGFLDFLGYPFCRGRLFDQVEEDRGQYNSTIECHWVSGACMMVRKEVFEKVGRLDADFFAHMEEIDICWRMRLAGYKMYGVADSIVYHVGGGTLPQGSPRKTYLNFRNNLSMLVKNVDGNAVFLIIFLRLILDGIAALQSIIKHRNFQDTMAIWSAHYAFYGLLGKNIQKRKEVFRLQKVSVKLYPKSIIWQYFVLKKSSIPVPPRPAS